MPISYLQDLEFRFDRERSSAASVAAPSSTPPTIGYAWFRMKWLDQWQAMDSVRVLQLLSHLNF